MKKRIAIFFVIFVVIAAMLVGCKVVTPDEAMAEASQKSMATQASQATQAAQASASPAASADSYNVADADSHVKSVSDAEYQKYLNEANTRSVEAGAPKDKYGTEPIPEGMPAPQEWQDAVVDKTVSKTCTLYIECATILNNMDKFNMDKAEVLPTDGVVYSAKKVTFYDGESVFDVLLRETQKNRIHMEYSMTPGYNSNYIEGINNLYEYDCGELSGWMYSVNGWFPNYGCSRYRVAEGDKIELHYTCDLGRDLGTSWVK
ncbi:MAG: DUF4430 domain-containing protein [Christensenella sp.]